MKHMAAALLVIMALAPAAQAGDHKGDYKKSKSIVDIAVSNDSFSTLVTALEAAGLVETLQGDGPFTVFAPTNEAFAKLPRETLDALLKPENRKKLQAVLTYHVVAGNVTSGEVVKLSAAETVQGEKVKIEVRDGNVMIDDAKVVTADVMAANGVIHVIDTVILPENL